MLADFIPTPSESTASRSIGAPDEEYPEWDIPEPVPPEPQTEAEPTPNPPVGSWESPVDHTPITEVPTQTTQTLRARSSASSQTPISHSTARAALFANRRKPASPQTTTATAEAILDQQRAEQDSISESILRMAGALKASSQSFSSSLEADKNVLDATGSKMEKSERGMESAQGRMGALKRMTEGQGWWGRMILYAWVYGLMITLVLFVFVFPKLRF